MADGPRRAAVDPDNVYYRQKKGAHWLPKWDLGRRRNLETFFNVGADG